MVRSTRGVTISDEGQRLLPQLTALVQHVQGLDRRETVGAAIAIAAPSYLITWCAPRIAEALPGTRVRALEMAPALIRTLAATNVFDACITLADERLPESWVSQPVGETRRSCFASPALRELLGPGPIAVDKILRVPFVLPVYQANGTYVPVDDGCPVLASQRIAGHEVQTMALALEIASATNQLVFGPVLAAYPFLADGRMVELDVQGWDERDPVYVACNVDRVRVPQQRLIANAVRTALAGLGAPERAVA